MSYRRRIISALSQNRQYIEGYCVAGTTDYTFQLGLSGTATLITVTPDANGYWRWYMPKGKYISTWVGAFTRQSQAESDKLVSINFHLDYDDIARQSNNLFGTYTTETSYFACTNLKKVTNLKLRSTTMSSMFSQCTSLEEFDMSGLEGRTSGFAMSYMFYNCTNLKHIYNSKYKTYNVTSIRYMFSLCSNLEEFEFGNWTIGGTINRLFLDCGKLKYVKRNNTTFAMSKTLVNYLFQDCYELEDIGDLFNSNYADIPVQDVAGMFDGCQKIKHIDISGVRMTGDYTTNNMFRNCYEVEDIVLQQPPTAMTKTMAYMFSNCYKLESVTGSFAGYKPTSLASAFNYCHNLKSLDLSAMDVSAATNLNGMFFSCWNLEDLALPSNMSSLPNGINAASLFRDCFALKMNMSNCPDFSGWSPSSTTYMLGCNSYTDLSNWETETGKTAFANFNVVSIPTMSNSMDYNSTNLLRYNSGVTTIKTCGDIYHSIYLTWPVLDYASIALVISKLQDVTGYEDCHIAFSTSNRNTIRNDATLMAAVQQKQAIGWIFDNL